MNEREPLQFCSEVRGPPLTTKCGEGGIIAAIFIGLNFAEDKALFGCNGSTSEVWNTATLFECANHTIGRSCCCVLIGEHHLRFGAQRRLLADGRRRPTVAHRRLGGLDGARRLLRVGPQHLRDSEALLHVRAVPQHE